MIKRLVRKLRKKNSPEYSSIALLRETRQIEEHLSLAAIYQVARKPRQAIDQCNYVLKLDSLNSTAYHIRAMAKYSIGDREGAKKDWDFSTTINT